MPNKKNQSNSNIIFFWTHNLVGSGGRFLFNMLLSLTGGILFSFNLWQSTIALAIFGVVSPLLFTLCLYSILRATTNNTDDSPLPKAFTKRQSNAIMMIVDMAAIIALAILIHTNTLNYLLIRLLQTTIFPALMLLMLRVLYVNIAHPRE
ncbi:MAG TPA: hypothetical protein ENN24_01285 [Bacteroidetes bacterium]|nr:hypothetical protein [Bacteroidota bacterium]